MTETIQIGTIVLRFLRSKHDNAGGLDMFEMDVAWEEGMPVPHYHRNWDETVYGVHGAWMFHVDGKPVTVGPGDMLFIPRGTVHGFENRSGTLATCLCVLTPGVLGPEYFREVSAVVAAGKPDPEVMHEIMLRHGLVPVMR